IPMHIERNYTQIGQADWAGFLTLNIYPRGTSTFLVHYADGSGETKVTVVQKNDLVITLDGAYKPHILRIFLKQKPLRVERDEKILSKGQDWFYSAQQNRLVVRTEKYEQGNYKIIW
ncbi:MAG: hypothetical protein GXO75_10380, partial [Calditrichaeota bacterium]|nr:hypothetical protein [Calditrichota bacterium]